MNIPFKISENDSFFLVAGESEYKVLHHAFNFGLSILVDPEYLKGRKSK